MLQRIQTVYFSIVIVLLSFVTFGVELFTFISDSSKYVISSYGIEQYSIESNELISHKAYPVYISTIALILLSFLALMSYKKLNRQFKLGRMVFGIYFLLVILLVTSTFMGESIVGSEIISRQMGLGFFLFICGFPFTFLANTGIKRDKNLLDSLERLR